MRDLSKAFDYVIALVNSNKKNLRNISSTQRISCMIYIYLPKPFDKYRLLYVINYDGLRTTDDKLL